jgi:HlyD family secretion protein
LIYIKIKIFPVLTQVNVPAAAFGDTHAPSRRAGSEGEMAMRRWRRIGLVGAVLLVGAAGGYGGWSRPEMWGTLFRAAPASERITLSGNVEAHQSVLSFTQVQAPIIFLPFDEGARVASGTVLARLDDSLYRQQTEIDRTNLKVAWAQVSANESSLLAAQNSVTSDQFDLTEKQRDFVRADELAKAHAVSQQTRDQAYTAARQSAAALARDQALVQQATDNIALAKANESAAEAKLKLDEVTLSYTELRAPFDGVISVREAELGELAGPGVAIFTIDELDHPWLRAYVNEPYIGRIRLDEPVDVATDAFPGKVYHGRISFISPEAEFTPKTVETHEERVTLVYRIRIDIDNLTHELLPGMPADAAIALVAPGT